MRTILLTNNYPVGPYEIVLKELPEGFNLAMLEENTQECIEAEVCNADYILASGRVKITEAVLDKATKLKMIQRTGVGLDSLDLVTIRKKKIPLYVNQGVNSKSVAEHTLLLMLACLRKLPQLHRNIANGIWKKQEQGVQTFELSGKTVGLIGMGNIAKAVVKLLRGFEVNVLYYDIKRLSSEEECQFGIRYCTLEELLPQVDILSLHCPLTENTRNIIDKNALEKMKKDAIIINTARGGLIDMRALAEALKTGTLAFAGLDVYDEEPLKEENPILSLENVVLTPHIGGITKDSFQKMMHDAMRNIERFENGKLDEIKQYLY